MITGLALTAVPMFPEAGNPVAFPHQLAERVRAGAVLLNDVVFHLVCLHVIEVRGM